MQASTESATAEVAGSPISQTAERAPSLASALLLLTLTGVVLGTVSLAPGLGYAAMIVIAPAIAHTVAEIQRRTQRGQSPSLREKAALFAASLSIAVMAGVSSVIAFFVICWGGFFAGVAAAPTGNIEFLLGGEAVGGILSGLLGLCVFVRVWKALT